MNEINLFVFYGTQYRRVQLICHMTIWAQEEVEEHYQAFIEPVSALPQNS